MPQGATLQFRGLASRGILHDPSPYDLEDTAWSGGSNVWFANTKASRAPVFRGVVDPISDPPAFVVGLPSATGFDSIIYAGATGRIYSYFSGTTTDVTPTGFTPATVTGQFTSDYLGSVVYINNPSQSLYYQGPAGGLFARDPAWDSTWKAQVFRVYGDYPIALNVTKGTTANPTLFKWGDTTLAGLTTSSWDHTDPTKNAGETPIAGLTGPLLDGRVMRSSFIIYSANEVWEVAQSGDLSVFHFRELFSEGGIIGTNCVTEVDGRHFVFGPNDIYWHDGVTKTSIVDKLNRSYIFSHLNKKQAGRCFIQHMPVYHMILFAYVSSDPDCAFQSPTVGCNKGFMFNYVDGTHSFVDLPNVTASSLANLNTVLTWATAGSLTWENMGGTWADQDDSYGRQPVFVSRSMTGISANRLLGYDYLDKGSLALPYVPEVNPPAFLERIGIDMDTEQAGLGSYKQVNRVYPQVTIYRNVPATVQVGASLYPSSPVKWTSPVTFDPSTQYKVDARQGGRYIAFRFSVPTPADFEVTGFDADVINNGMR